MKVLEIRTLVDTGEDRWYEVDVEDVTRGLLGLRPRAETRTYVLNCWKDSHNRWVWSWSLPNGTYIGDDDLKGKLRRVYEYYRVREKYLEQELGT